MLMMFTGLSPAGTVSVEHTEVTEVYDNHSEAWKNEPAAATIRVKSGALFVVALSAREVTLRLQEAALEEPANAQ